MIPVGQPSSTATTENQLILGFSNGIAFGEAVGIVQVWKRNGAQFGLSQTLTPLSPTELQGFGSNLAVDGAQLVVCATDGAVGTGMARYFQGRSGWVRRDAVYTPSGRFHAAPLILRDAIVAGSPRIPFGRGQAHVFRPPGTLMPISELRVRSGAIVSGDATDLLERDGIGVVLDASDGESAGVELVYRSPQLSPSGFSIGADVECLRPGYYVVASWRRLSDGSGLLGVESGGGVRRIEATRLFDQSQDIDSPLSIFINAEPFNDEDPAGGGWPLIVDQVALRKR